MGLDIAFNRKEAEKAGLEFELIPNNGTYDEGDDPEYIRWCQDSEECIKVPGCDHYTSNSGTGTDVVVRANKWGSTYYPLTEWLVANGIKWSEF